MISRTYSLDSAKRDGGTNESPSWKIQLPSQISDFERVAVLGCMIPKSYYGIQSGLNTFILQEGKLQATITIPPANYSRSVMQTLLGTLLTSGSPSGYTYTLSWPSSSTGQTGKYTYNVTGNGGVQPSLIMTSASPYEFLGFASLSTNTFAANSLTSTNVIMMQGESTLFIHSNLVSPSSESTDTLQHIYVSNPDFSNIVYTSPHPLLTSKAFNHQTGGYITMSLTDENGFLMNLNGLSFNITICIFGDTAKSVSSQGIDQDFQERNTASQIV